MSSCGVSVVTIFKSLFLLASLYQNIVQSIKVVKRRTANIKPRTINMILKKGSPTLKLLLSAVNGIFAEALITVDTIPVDEVVGWRAFREKSVSVPGTSQLNFAVSMFHTYFY